MIRKKSDPLPNNKPHSNNRTLLLDYYFTFCSFQVFQGPQSLSSEVIHMFDFPITTQKIRWVVQQFVQHPSGKLDFFICH